jgi:hypothetical protein
LSPAVSPGSAGGPLAIRLLSTMHWRDQEPLPWPLTVIIRYILRYTM